MVTLIGKLCGLCAISTLLDMLTPQDGERSGVRTVCGMLMLHLTLTQGRNVVLNVMQAGELDEMIRILMG